MRIPQSCETAVTQFSRHLYLMVIDVFMECRSARDQNGVLPGLERCDRCAYACVRDDNVCLVNSSTKIIMRNAFYASNA